MVVEKIECVIFCFRKNEKRMPIFCKKTYACSIVAIPPKVIIKLHKIVAPNALKLQFVISMQPWVISTNPFKIELKTCQSS